MSHFTFHPDQELAVFASYFPEFIPFWEERAGISSHCISAEQSWVEACKDTGQDPIELLGEFALVVKPLVNHAQRDWTLATLDELIDEIISNHHAYVRVQLGRMTAIVCYMARCNHGPRLDELVALFNHLNQSWTVHLEMEELHFFPNCLRLENYQDSMSKQDLDELIELLQQATHDHHHLEETGSQIIKRLDMLEKEGGYEQTLFVLRQAVEEFLSDAVIHSDKEDGVLIPAVMFAHDVRRSDSESGRLKAL